MRHNSISYVLFLSYVLKLVEGEECHIETVNSTVRTIIRKTPNRQDKLWILPTTNFQMSITLEIDNLLTIGPPFVIEQNLLITPEMLRNCSSDWQKLTIRIDKKEIPLWGDPIVIIVSILNETHTLETDYWWRKNHIEKIIISAVGNLHVAVGCKNRRDIEEIDRYGVRYSTISAKHSADDTKEILTERSSDTNILSILIYSMIPILICLILLAAAVWFHKIRRRSNEYDNHKDEPIYEELKIENLGKLDHRIEPEINLDQRYTDFVTARGQPSWQIHNDQLDSRRGLSGKVDPSVRYDSPRSLHPLPEAIYLEMGSSASSIVDRAN